MVLFKILKRRDASSVVVAILLAMVISQPLSIMTSKPAGIISGNSQGAFAYGPGGNWKEQYLFPVVWALMQIIALELVSRVYVYATHPVRRRRRKS